jgi:hypothetical protein
LGHRSRTLQAGIVITSMTAGGIIWVLAIGSILSAVRKSSPARVRRRRPAWAPSGD